MSDAALKSIDRESLVRLAEAMLLQALDDYHSKREELRQGARRWFVGETDGGFTFDLCCRLLHEQPESMLEKLQLPVRTEAVRFSQPD